MERIYDSDEIGPVGFMFCAEALAHIGCPYAKDFSVRGATRLSKDELRKDLRVLFAGNGLISRSAEKFVFSLRQMPDQDIEAVVALLPPDLAPVMRKAAAQAKSSPVASGTQILTSVIEDNWDEVLRPALEKRLNALATGSAESKVAESSALQRRALLTRTTIGDVAQELEQRMNH